MLYMQEDDQQPFMFDWGTESYDEMTCIDAVTGKTARNLEILICGKKIYFDWIFLLSYKRNLINVSMNWKPCRFLCSYLYLYFLIYSTSAS